METTLDQFQQQLRTEESFRRNKAFKAKNRKEEKRIIDRIMDYIKYDYSPPGAHPSVDGYKVKVEFTIREFDLLCMIMKYKNIDYEKLSKIMGIAKTTISTNAYHLKELITYSIFQSRNDNFDPQLILRIKELRMHREENKMKEAHYNNIKKEAEIFKLGPKEVFILVHRAGIYGYRRLTLQKIGKILKVTPSRVRQIEAVALRRLRHPYMKKSSTLACHIEESGFYKEY